MLESIIAHFSLPGKLFAVDRFGSGLINDTYLCEFNDRGMTRKYILQRINTAVFRHPEQVMENVETVTAHIANRLRERGVADPSSVTPALVNARDGRSHHVNGDGACWRMYHFIESGEVFDLVQDERHAFEVGRALGAFQSLVCDLPPARLHDTLPGFHMTPRYLEEFDAACRDDVAQRAAGAERERAFVEARRSLASALTARIDSGEIPLRVVHNDPKVNNVMIHATTREALCMLDLDTVKPGIVHFDFGDCVRSAANRSGEDAPDPAVVALDHGLYHAILRGYLEEARTFLTEKEISLLPASVGVMTFELGIRFLADYIRGDTYFKTTCPGHNLLRARVQFRLLESIEAADLRTVL
jgi:Ser/Thr protein kinase RdoA (MazF antagonist)